MRQRLDFALDLAYGAAGSGCKTGVPDSPAVFDRRHYPHGRVHTYHGVVSAIAAELHRRMHLIFRALRGPDPTDCSAIPSAQ
jgi:hypothetical protein